MNGYGSQGRAFSQGLCMFNAPDKISQMANKYPFYGRKEVQHCAYFREYYSHLDKRLEIERLL